MSARIGPADQAWWPDDPGPSWLHAARWCNGSSGVATFLLRFWRATGNFFLDLAAGTGDPRYVTAAWATAAQLWELRAWRAGRWLIPDETGRVSASISATA